MCHVFEMDGGWSKHKERRIPVIAMIASTRVHWIGLDSLDISHRALWTDQVRLISMLHNPHHTCMYMYIALTVFRLPVTVVI